MLNNLHSSKKMTTFVVFKFHVVLQRISLVKSLKKN